MKISTRTDTAITMTTSNNGAAMPIEHVTGYSIVISVTRTSGTLAGDFTLQASNNAFLDNVNNNVNTSATWVTVASSTAAISTTTTATAMYNVSDAQYSAYRIVWTRSGGEGSYTAYHYTKGVQS